MQILTYPIAHSDSKFLLILVIEIRLIIMHNEGLTISIGVAVVRMTMVPVRSILSDSEVVGEIGSWRNWTLQGDQNNSKASARRRAQKETWSVPA